MRAVKGLTGQGDDSEQGRVVMESAGPSSASGWAVMTHPTWQKAVRIAGWVALVIDALGLVGAGILRWVGSPCNPDLFALTLLLICVVRPPKNWSTRDVVIASNVRTNEGS